MIVKMSNKTKKLAYTAMLLAICIVCTLIKRMSVMLSGSIVNSCLILATLMIGTYNGILLSILIPIFSYFITHNPIQAAVPLVVPFIMVGNIILCTTIAIFKKKCKETEDLKLIESMIVGAIFKALFMGIFIAYIVLPVFLPRSMSGILETAQYTFSFIQFFTALIGSAIATLIYKALKKLIV